MIKKEVKQMEKNSVMILGFACMVLCIASAGFAADTATVAVNAAIPQQNGLTVTVSKVLVADNSWTPATSIDFGSLTFDNTNSIFTADSYYAVDVGISSNDADWGVKHTTSSIVNGTETLDNNVNVTFIKQLDAATSDPNPLAYVSFANSNNQEFRKAAIGTGWLRVYYGIATGNPTTPDAPGVTPIGSAKTYGSYTGSVTLTLVP
jgi:hypothetical protein